MPVGVQISGSYGAQLVQIKCCMNAANADAAQALWEDAGAALPDDYAAALIPYLGHQHEDVRSAAADALAAAVEV
jgi:hypothetical protein